MMRNELLMKTLPGAARWIYVLFHSPSLPPVVEVGEKEEAKGEMRGGRKRTNALDYNKELSQQIAWPYINHAEAMGDLPTSPEHSHAPLGLPQDSESQNKTSEHDYTGLYSQGKHFISVLTLSTTTILMARDPWSRPCKEPPDPCP